MFREKTGDNLAAAGGFGVPSNSRLARGFDLDEIQALSIGDPRICVAVLDGPVDLAHPCFDGALLSCINSLVPNCGTGAASVHGTHVASVIFGQSGSPVVGIAPGCRGIIIPIFADGHDDAFVNCSQVDLARAILLAAEHGAHVINISGGQLSQSGEPDALLESAIAACAEANILIVAAAGNDGCECLHLPAAVTPVLSVGALAADGMPMPNSNWGEPYLRGGIVAPGQEIVGARPGGGVGRMSGTSAATPIVAGVAALLLSRQVESRIDPDPLAVRDALIESAEPCAPGSDFDCRRLLAGELNAHRALEMTMSGRGRMSETLVRASSVDSDLIEPLSLASEADHLGASADEVSPSGCGGGPGCTCRDHADSAKPAPKCACGDMATKPPQLVYALGLLGYDFGTEARRDAFRQRASAYVQTLKDADQKKLVNESGTLARFVRDVPSEAESFIWTLSLDATPIYAIRPSGAFAADAYRRLLEALEDQYAEALVQRAEIVAVPGVISGTARLLSGQVVPVIHPAPRGIFTWNIGALVTHIIGERPSKEKDQVRWDKISTGLGSFLSRVYYDLRNLGLSPQDRALNYSATNAFHAREVTERAIDRNLDLDGISVKRSPICRPGSECYDVKVGFFDPNNANVADRVFRFTVDVSDVVPVSIGNLREWTRRPCRPDC